MTKLVSAVIGKWRIFESDLWEASDLDLVEPAYIRFDANGCGAFLFICVSATMLCAYGPNGVDFDWQGFDEMDEVSGSGDANLSDDGILTITISRHMGDEATLRARPW